MKIRPVGAELFHADKHGEAISHFSQFCEKRLKQPNYCGMQKRKTAFLRPIYKYACTV
jgi:hypothetical protein